MRRGLRYIDRSRPTRASGRAPGAPERTLDLLLWQAAAEGGERQPLVVYCHGTCGCADEAAYLAEALAARGCIVVAPAFPLTSLAAFERAGAADIADCGEQVRDLSFLIDALLADPALGDGIDPGRIAGIGHSLGAVTLWFLCFGEGRDPRAGAAVLLGAGDPVAAARAPGMDLGGGSPAGGVATLLVSAEHDLFAAMTGPPGAAYARLPAPRYEVTVRGGTHSWFTDSDDRPADGRNPDCLFFERFAPDVPVAGAASRAPLIEPQRQRAITLAAVTAFLDARFAGTGDALARLEALPARFPEATVTGAE